MVTLTWATNPLLEISVGRFLFLQQSVPGLLHATVAPEKIVQQVTVHGKTVWSPTVHGSGEGRGQG